MVTLKYAHQIKVFFPVLRDISTVLWMTKYAISHLLLGVLFDNGRIIGPGGRGKEGRMRLGLEILEICCLSNNLIQELMVFLLIFERYRSIAH